MAISGSSGKRKLYLGDTGSSGGHSLFNENSAASNIKEVSTMSIGDLMTELKMERIDFLKLDCEGAENEIIDSLNNDTASRILNIVMEFHKVDDRKPEYMIKKLHALGYQTKSENGGGYIYSKRL
jgi:FkbM family methyltransferase